MAVGHPYTQFANSVVLFEWSQDMPHWHAQHDMAQLSIATELLKDVVIVTVHVYLMCLRQECQRALQLVKHINFKQ
jgi:hypothetical protein